MLVLLVGPKGSGKSHVGRVLERNLGLHFLHVEPLWMSYYAKCKEAAREPSIPEGISFVHPHVIEALRINKNVCAETTGASPEILNDLLSLTQSSNTLVVRVAAPLQLCLERIGSRDQTNQIPMDTETIRKVHALSDAAEIQPSFVLDNTLPLSDVEIIAMFKSAL